MSRVYNGMSVGADILTSTVDGVDLSTIWAEFESTIAMYNQDRTRLIDQLVFRTTAAGDEVLQSNEPDGLEPASQFGLAKGVRAPASSVPMGFPLDWFDARVTYSFEFLRDATADQVRAQHSAAIASDDKTMFTMVMDALFDPTHRTNKELLTVYGLWSADGMVPPPFGGQVFDGSHSHYFNSGSTSFDGEDMSVLMGMVTEHGYGQQPGDQILILCNPAEGKVIRKMRATDDNGAYDFVPAQGTAPYLSAVPIIGDLAPATYNGLKIAGSYGDALVSENYLIPQGYIVALASSGVGSATNPIALREHTTPGMQGFVLVGGSGQPDTYPIIGASYIRGAGCGVRHRGAAAIMQVGEAPYSAPVLS